MSMHITCAPLQALYYITLALIIETVTMKVSVAYLEWKKKGKVWLRHNYSKSTLNPNTYKEFFIHFVCSSKHNYIWT